jgi:hypothetical protein
MIGQRRGEANDMRAILQATGWISALMILWAWHPAAADLYHWVDENGVRHFSNTRPPAGVESSVIGEEIPYDPETDSQRRAQEDAMLKDRESAETQRRLEEAERKAEEARRQAEAAKRKADRLEKELEEQEEDRSYGVYYPRRRPGHRPPGYRPPGQRPPGQRPPDWRPRPEPYDPKKPWKQRPRQEPRGQKPAQRPVK